MIRLITASPGSGKTCIVIEWLIKEVDRGFYKEFYSNIEGLTIQGVRPLPPDADWRLLNPDKSKDEPPKLVIIDEAQYFDAFMKENRSVNNKIGKDLSTHRHYGVDIWFITQSTKLLNDYVLENVGEHVHMYRPQKKQTVSVYWWSYVQKSLTKSAFKDADDMQKWRLNPAMFDYYKSTSSVTDNKARTSHKVVSVVVSAIILVVVSAIILFAFIAFMINNGVGSFNKMTYGETKAAPSQIQPSQIQETQPKPEVTQPQQQETTLEQRRIYLYNQDLPPDYEIRRNDPALQVRGVIQMQSKCQAYNAYGDLMTLPPSDCKQYVGTGRVYKSMQASHNASYVTIDEAQGGVWGNSTPP